MRVWVFLFSLGVSIQNCVNLGNPQGIGPTGFLYANYTIALSGTSTSYASAKEGRACVRRIFFLFTSGDAGVEAAVLEGSITTVHHIEREIQNYFLLYTKVCTVVRGL